MRVFCFKNQVAIWSRKEDLAGLFMMYFMMSVSLTKWTFAQHMLSTTHAAKLSMWKTKMINKA